MGFSVTKFSSVSLALSLSDLKLRYRGSVLGFLWSFLNPFLMLVTLYVVFHWFMRIDMPHYELYLLLGITLWSFFSRGTSAGLASPVSKAYLVKKANLPREIIVLSACLTEFYCALINLAVFAAILLAVGAELSPAMLLFPVVLAKLMMLVLGISFFLATANVFFRDTTQIWEVLVQALFWMSPIAYSLDYVPDWAKWAYMLNPVADCIVSARDVLLYQRVGDLWSLLFGTAYYALVLGAGLMVFKRYAPYFAEEL